MSKAWLDTTEYPFYGKYYDTWMGRMHYIDEGQGDVLLFLHGNPTWSFTYRKLIKQLSTNYRCIAVDYIGFGLSDKPSNWSYKPELHANYIESFVSKQNLKNITLVVNDWGGPIGLSYALKHPENVKSLVLFNTWMWSVKGDAYYERFSGFMGGMIGRFLIKQFNFFGRSVIASATGNKENFPKETRKMYYKHLEKPNERKGCWVFPKEIIQSSPWLNGLWEKRYAIQSKPVLIMWGMKDIAFRADVLKKWSDFFLNAEIVTFEDAGHYPQEERGEEAAKLMAAFLKEHQSANA